MNNIQPIQDIEQMEYEMNDSTNQPATGGIAFTRYTSDKGSLTKKAFLVKDESKPRVQEKWNIRPEHPSKLKLKAAAMMYAGKYETIHADGLEAFNDVLDTLEFTQATGYGIGPEASGTICTKKKEGVNGAVARSKGNFKFSAGPGMFMIDIDPRDGNDALSAQDAHAALVKAMPELDGVRMLCRASASSNLWFVPPGDDVKSERQLRGPGGWHFYFVVDRAERIPDIGETLSKCLWLDSRGYILISGFGSQLVRCLVDTCVWQGERLDFAAGAECKDNGCIERRPTSPAYFGTEAMLMTGDVIPLTDAEEAEYAALVAAEKVATEPAAKAQHDVWLDARADEALPSGYSAELKFACITDLEKALEDQTLPLSFVVHLEEGKPITLKAMLADRDKYDGMMICDPFEPEYRGWAQNTKVRLKRKTPELCSWAHGVKRVFTFAAAQGVVVKVDAKKTELEEATSDSRRSLVLAGIARSTLTWDPISEEWYKYAAGHWTVMTQAEVMSALCVHLDKELPDGYPMALLRNMIGFLKVRLVNKKWNSDRHLLPMRNGVLDLKTMTLLPHDHAYKFQWVLPYDFTPGADCPTVKEFLLDATNGDTKAVESVRAALFFALLFHFGTQKFMEILGPGGTGKSTLIRLILKFIGVANCMTTDLKNLEANKFETAGLYGKRAAFINDSSRYSGEVSQLKSISGEDPIRYEKKGKQQEANFIAECFIFIVSNEPVQSADYSSGLSRRRVPINFLKQITDVDRDKWRAQGGIEAVMKKELPGMLNWVIGMGKDAALAALGGINGEMTKAQLKHLLQTNPLAEWVEDKCVLTPGVKTYTGCAPRVADDIDVREENVATKLYSNYHYWCQGAGHKPMAVQRYGKMLEELLVNMLKQPVEWLEKDVVGRSFSGISIRNNNNKDIPTPILKEMLS